MAIKVDKAVRNAIEADKRVQIVADLGNRLVVEIDLTLMKEHPDLKRIRAGSPDDIKHLAKSVRRDKDTIYLISLFCELDEESGPRYWIGDGHQRHRALAEAGATKTYAQVVLSWRSPADAMQDGVRLNTARYQLTDDDIMEISATGMMSSHELADASGKGVQSIERYALVAAHDYLRVAVKEKFIGYVPASKLVEKCASNPRKLQALKGTFLEAYDDAEKQVAHWKHKIKADRGRVRPDNKTRQKQHLSFYGRRQDWRLWGQLIEDDEIIDKDGQLFLNLAAASKAPLEVYIGDEKEWEESIALGNFGNRKWSDIEDSELAKLAKHWDWIGDQIQKRWKQRQQALASEAELEFDSAEDDYAEELERQQTEYMEQMEPAGEADEPDQDDQTDSASTDQS